MIKQLIIFLSLFCFTHVGAQNKTFTLSLYFAINEISSLSNFSRIDSLCASLQTSTCTINILGYADFLNSSAYNKVLSQRRTETIKNYLVKNKGAATLSIAGCKGQGEIFSKDNFSTEGEPVQRRVDLIINQRTSFKKIGTRDNKIQEVASTKETTTTPDNLKNKVLSETKKNPGEKKGIEDLEKGESLAIEGLSFIPGRHILVKSAIPVLEELLNTLKDHSTLKIEIQGHICCLNSEEEDGFDFDTHDRKLSENRAKAIYNYLVRNGIDKDRLTYKGYGHTNPKIKIERSPEDEQVNRRVEIKILEN